MTRAVYWIKLQFIEVISRKPAMLGESQVVSSKEVLYKGLRSQSEEMEIVYKSGKSILKSNMSDSIFEPTTDLAHPCRAGTA